MRRWPRLSNTRVAAHGLAAALCVLAGFCSAQAKDGWIRIKPTDGGFSLEVPETVMPSNKEIDTPLGKLTFRAYYAVRGDMAYVLMYTDYPSEPLRKYTPAQILKSARSSAIARTYGKVRSERSFRFQGCPARDLVLDANVRDAVIHCRIVLAGRRLYEVMVAGPPKTAKDPSVRRYIDSFRLLKSAPAHAKPATPAARKSR